MNVKHRHMTVMSMPAVQMNVDHTHASVTMVTLEMAMNAIVFVLPVL